jgi:hypothetical protein
MAQQFAPVPLSHRGVWRRTLLTTAGNAVVDTDTEVRWLQTASAFGDVRIPKAQPGDAAAAAAAVPLAQRDARQLEALTPQYGFAGHTAVIDDICQWHREVRRRGPSL